MAPRRFPRLISINAATYPDDILQRRTTRGDPHEIDIGFPDRGSCSCGRGDGSPRCSARHPEVFRWSRRNRSPDRKSARLPPFGSRRLRGLASPRWSQLPCRAIWPLPPQSLFSLPDQMPVHRPDQVLRTRLPMNTAGIGAAGRTSGLNLLKRRIQALQFDTGIGGREVPVGLGVVGVAALAPRVDLGRESGGVGDAAVEALAGEHGQL